MVEFFNKKSEFEALSFGKPVKGNDGRYFVACYFSKENEPADEVICQFSKQITNTSKIVVDGGTELLIADEDTIEFIKECDEKLLELCKQNKALWFPGKEISDTYVEQAFMESLKEVKKHKNKAFLKSRTSKDFVMFNSSKDIIDVVDLKEQSKLAIIIQLAGLWFSSSRFGITWKLRQGKLLETEKVNKFEKSLFIDEEEEEEADMNVFPDE